MKRSRSPSPQNQTKDNFTSQELKQESSSSPSESTTMSSVCPHLTQAFTQLNPPRPSQQIHREECTLCFDDQDGPEGVDVCLLCFNGSCPSTSHRSVSHSNLHFKKTGHSLVVNVKRRLKPKTASEQPPPPKKLAIQAESEADKYNWEIVPKCLACDGKELPRTDKLEEVIKGMMSALSSSQQSEVKAWEEEILPCQHTRELKQTGEATKLEASGLAKCGKCDLTSNLWLCLTCGHLGCGRAQFGGVGGNSHGLTHFEESGHPVSVKQGTITAEGTADIYCYACNDARIDPSLSTHLKHFGINVMDLSKTEKSMTELQLEQNLKFDFNMTGEDGKELEPLFGPGLTGLKNLGNSCYLASVVQTLFSISKFQTRYLNSYVEHTNSCKNLLPSSCIECQMNKLADGLLSGRYSVPRTLESPISGSLEEEVSSTDGKENGKEREGPIFQSGIKPSMFKSLIGKGHEEFSTMRQQDADEFFKHLISILQRDSKRLESETSQGSSSTSVSFSNDDPTKVFSFGLQQRLQCNDCKKVRYTIESQEAGLSLPVPLRIQKEKGKSTSTSTSTSTSSSSTEIKTTENSTSTSSDQEKIIYESVSLLECLDLFTSPEALEYHCPSCKKNVIATKQVLFTSFPDYLVIQARRFQLINWVPQKVDVPIEIPLESFTLDKYLGIGKRDDENELPEEEVEEEGKIEFDQGAMSQLSGMGFPEVRCQRALLATGNTGDAEAAMNWLFSHMEDSDIDDPIDFKALTSSPNSSSTNKASPDTSALEDMGFTKSQATKALRLNGNNPEIAVAWLFENPDDPGEEVGMNLDQEVGTSSGETEKKISIGGSSDLPAKYRIKSFISHKGPSVHSGHYVAHIRKPTTSEDGDNAWVFFNDEKVVKAPFTTAVSSTDSADVAQADVGVKGLSKLAYEYFFERET